jgi:hypothetical protein
MDRIVALKLSRVAEKVRNISDPNSPCRLQEPKSALRAPP